MKPKRTMSEACIHANIHVPEAVLPNIGVNFYQNDATTSRTSFKDIHNGLPILVFVHGGGFLSGSGDTDIHGPEYLVGKGMIVATFNYRYLFGNY